MSKRKIITIPYDLIELIEKSMKKTKSTFSEWMRDAAREKLGLAVILALCLMGCGDFNPVADTCQESNQTLSVNFDNGYPVVNCQTEIPGKVYKGGL